MTFLFQEEFILRGEKKKRKGNNSKKIEAGGGLQGSETPAVCSEFRFQKGEDIFFTRAWKV